MSASQSSVCPLPCTPAMPRISPALTWNDSPFTGRPPESATVRSATSSTTSPGRAGCLLTRSCTSLPTIRFARSSSVTGGVRWPTVLPRRSTVMVSAIAWTSLSLWEMKMTEVPVPVSWRMIRNSSSVSAGVSTAVGSSRMSTFACLTSALTISTRCWMPTGSSPTSASGSTSRPYRCERSATSLRALRRSRRPARDRIPGATTPPNLSAPGGTTPRPPREKSPDSMPSVTFSATVKTGTSMKCWCTMPMPASIASFGEPNFAGLPLIRISPSSGWVSPYRTFISVVFPAPFSPRRAWTWPGATDRLIPSFAASRPYLLVMPLSSSSTYVRPRLDRALGRRLDAPVLDSGLDRLQLRLQRGGNRA